MLLLKISTLWNTISVVDSRKVWSGRRVMLRIAAGYNNGETTLTFENGDQTVTKKAFGFTYIAVADGVGYELPGNAQLIKIWPRARKVALDLSELGLKTPIFGSALIENTGDSILVWRLRRGIELDNKFNTDPLRAAGIRPIKLTI